MGYRSLISAGFRSGWPEILTSPVLHGLCRSFRVEAPASAVTPPSWVLLNLLEYITSPVFDPLHQFSLRDLTQ